MTNTCPECGAVWKDDLTCQLVFDEFLVLEFTDEGYGSVHFLTVACYMIQHGQYSDEALAWVDKQLCDYLEKGITTEEIRAQAVNVTGQGERTWKVMRQPGEPPQAKLPWSMTIVDVAERYHDAASYRERIQQWARATLQDMQPLLH